MTRARPLLASDEVIETQRLRLSRLQREDVETLAPHLAAALAPDWRLDDLTPWVEAGAGVLIGDATGEAIGAAVVAIGLPGQGDAAVPFIAVESARRFCGLGGEAGLAIEQLLREKHDVRRVFAPVPDGRGLAVYFWLRLGYRPLTASESPGPLLGLTEASLAGIWMLREGV